MFVGVNKQKIQGLGAQIQVAEASVKMLPISNVTKGLVLVP